VWVFLPRFVRMKVHVLPRTAWFGLIEMPLSVIVTLTVKIAGAFVVLPAGPATARAASAAQAGRTSFLTRARVPAIVLPGLSTPLRTIRFECNSEPSGRDSPRGCRVSGFVGVKVTFRRVGCIVFAQACSAY